MHVRSAHDADTLTAWPMAKAIPARCVLAPRSPRVARKKASHSGNWRATSHRAANLIAFEKGRAWPRETDPRGLEEVVQWPPGELARIHAGTKRARERAIEAASRNRMLPKW